MSQNDITGDEITSKAASDAYRANYDRVFRQQAPEQARGTVQADSADRSDSADSKPPSYKDIVKTYKKIGCANSYGFKEPDGSGPWRRCHQSVSGCYEVYCDDKLQIYYDCFCD